MKNLLILGGTGRMGSALAACLGGRFKVTTLARNEYADLRADINDFVDYQGYDVVVNCAAMKDVVKCETQVPECIAANVTGVAFSLEHAARCGVKRYIYISTDMAVDVKNVYGASKKIADALVVNMARTSNTECCVVRLGNIIGSAGSIFTTLASKSKELGYMPITDIGMTRFLMMASDCADFVSSVVEYKGSVKGDIFAPKCKSYRVVDIAKAVAENVPIRVIGKRLGDELSVTMISDSELLRTTSGVGGHYRILPPWSDEHIEVVDMGGLAYLSSENNPSFASVEELRDIYCSLLE
ncbi:MAG: polysaccharide biosynthesis protein [Bacteroidales bacterium]